MTEISRENCFLEAHYYSAGLRIDPLGVQARPSWAPEQETVGFRDEFELVDGDAAIELRRFEIGDDLITWVGVFHRSQDAKLGDRRNHAGVGAWYRNAIPFDFARLLDGMDQLSCELARSMNPNTIVDGAHRFAAEFLPMHAMDVRTLEPATGFPFAPAGIVETALETVRMNGSLLSTRSLTDYLAFKSFGETEPVPPRLLVLATRRPDVRETISDHFDFATTMLAALPNIRKKDREEAAAQTERADAAELRSAELQKSLSALETESAELRSFKDDPLRAVVSRLTNVEEELRALSGSLMSYSPAPSPPASSGNQWISRGRRSPVNRSTTTRNIEVDEDGIPNWLFLVFVVLGVAAALTIVYLIVNQLAPMISSAWHSR